MDTSFDTYVQWLEAVRSAATVKMARTAATSLHRHTHTSPEHLTEGLAVQWMRALSNNAAQTRASYHTALAGYYRWRTERDPEAADPLRGVPRAHPPKGRPRPISQHHVRHLLAVAEDPCRTWIALAYYAGLRRAEIASLSAANVTTDHSGLPLLEFTGKGGKRRVQPVCGPLAPYLEGFDWPQATPDQIGQRVIDTMTRHGVRGSVHQLRHSHGQHLYDTTGDLAVVAGSLGHASVATTQIYADASTAHVRRTLERVFTDAA